MEHSYDGLLLSTKLKIPAPRKNYVARKALYEKLSLADEMNVIFIRGGAGTGKTTLLSSYIRETGLKNVGWLSLDETNSNVHSFWLYFTAAVNAFLGEDGDFLSLLRSTLDASHMEGLLTILINRLCGEEDYYLVLDDVHWIKEEALVKTMEYFLNALPDNVHLFMLSREDPPVYLGALAVSGRLLFIDGKQMELSSAEGLAFLKQTLQMKGSDEELSVLNDYAEGWVGGLQLAVAAGAAGKNSAFLFRAGGGIAADYLTREVFASLAEGERNFLIATGFLSYFDADLCAHLIKDFNKAQFERMIGTLIEKNLFIICIDEQNGVYRYHNMLSEYLKRQFAALPEEKRKALHEKAALAFEGRGDREEALREYCAMGDYDSVLRVAAAMEGRVEAWSYLDQIPVEKLIENADLAAQCFMYDLSNLNMERCRVLYEKFKTHYGDSGLFQIMQFAEAYVSKSGGMLPEYQTLTAKQIAALHVGKVAKAMVLVENGAALLEAMAYEEAEDCIRQAVDISGGMNAFVDFFAYNQLAQIYEETGRLNDSLSAYDKSRELIHLPALMSGVGTNFYFGLTGVYMRRMERKKAEETLTLAADLLKKHHIQVDVTDITLIFHLAEMRFLYGDDTTGAACVKEILKKYPSFSVLTLGRLIHELACAGMLEKSLGDAFLKDLAASDNYGKQPFMRLLRARIRFERGEKEAAKAEIEEVLAFSREHKNKLRLVEADLLKVWMLFHDDEIENNRREINNLLREAVYYAYEDRLMMPFFLDRATLLPLLSAFYAQSGKSGMSEEELCFLKDVIVLCGGMIDESKARSLLSSREIEVLAELGKGLTNRQIAETLCISPATVKSHVLSIFSKLDVSSRVVAVKVGQDKGLI